jgi:SHS2 domain-containing protein
MKYKFLKHTADVKFQVFGKSLKELFENSIEALLNSMTSSKIKDEKSFKINVKGKDLEALLYAFLEEVLILIDSENFLVSRVEFEIDEKNFKISGKFFGDDISHYDIRTHIKSVTYSEMFVKKEKDNFIAQVVLDV